MVKEWICQEEPLIRADGASVGVGFRQMTELVRCNDCKYGEQGACGDGVDCDGVWHDGNWFCADGEREGKG